MPRCCWPPPGARARLRSRPPRPPRPRRRLHDHAGFSQRHPAGAKCLDANLRPRGVGVVLEAEHTRMTQRGIRALGATTVTSALLGTLRTDARSRAEFFALARVPAAPGPI
ncbi:MAG TPA: GTP cyclohydrolase I [Streptosporangiaceae bacterium]|nr:GTP cyclohydrolase I [Streptosporangiaceae bacterium]